MAPDPIFVAFYQHFGSLTQFWAPNPLVQLRDSPSSYICRLHMCSAIFKTKCCILLIFFWKLLGKINVCLGTQISLLKLNCRKAYLCCGRVALRGIVGKMHPECSDPIWMPTSKGIQNLRKFNALVGLSPLFRCALALQCKVVTF